MYHGLENLQNNQKNIIYLFKVEKFYFSSWKVCQRQERISKYHEVNLFYLLIICSLSGSQNSTKLSFFLFKIYFVFKSIQMVSGDTKRNTNQNIGFTCKFKGHTNSHFSFFKQQVSGLIESTNITFKLCMLYGDVSKICFCWKSVGKELIC